MSKLKLISNNIKYNFLSQVFTLAVYFVLLPFIIAHTGKEIYGIYILVTTFTGYLGLLDFGVSSAIIKFVAEFKGKKEDKKVNEFISATFTFYFLIGLVSMVLLLVMPFCFSLFFKTTVTDKNIIRQFFWIAAIASVVIWPARTFEGVLQGLQKYSWLAVSNFIAALFTGISAYIIFTRGFSIVFYLGVSYIFILLKYIIAYAASKKELATNRIIFPFFDKAVFGKIFNFSLYLFLCSLTNIVIFNLDNFVVGAIVGISAVTLFNVAANLQNVFRMVNSLVGGPLFPVSAELEGQMDQIRQKKLLLKGTQYTTFVFIPMVIITIIFSRHLINSWMGPGFQESVIVAQVLLIFWLFNGILSVGGGILNAKGYVKPLFNIGLINAAFNLILSILLAKRIGILGVALGTTIPMVLFNFPMVLAKIIEVMKIKLSEYIDSCFTQNILIYAVASGLSFILVRFIPPGNIIAVILEMAAAYIGSIFAGYLAFSRKQKQELMLMLKF